MPRLVIIVVLLAASCATSPPAVSPPASTGPARPSPAASGIAAASASASPFASPGTTPNLVRTLDATVAEHALPPALSAVAFVDRWTGWAAGSGIILGTTDGGTTWRPAWSGSRLILSLSVVDRLHVWGLGYPNQQSTADRLIRTDEGGRTWTATTLSGGFDAIAFTTDQIGWAVVGGINDGTSGPGRLESTLDGGLHWRTTSLTAGVDSVCFASPSLGWAASGSAVYRTLDGGRAWTKVARGPNDALNSGWQATVSCSGTSAWVLSTGGGAAGSEAYRVTRTLDGGAHWATVLAGLDDALPTLPGIDAYAGPFTAVGAGSAGFAGWCPACGGAGTWSYTRTDDGGRTVSRAPLAGLTGATVRDITFADATHGWIAGAAAGGFLLATDDGGRTWRRAYPSTALRPALDVSFVSPQIGFGLGIIGDARAIERTDDGGQSWRAIGRLPVDPAWLDVDPILWFVDPSHGWVATLRGLLATTDGGATWQSVPGAPPGGVAFADAEHGCAGSFFAPAVRTTDGGRTWSPIAADRGVVVCAWSLLDPAWLAAAGPFDPGNLLAIAAIVDPAHAWALGLLDTGVTGLAATSGGGATWTAYRWPSPDGTGGFSLDDVTRLSFITPTTGWAFTQFGRLFETQDGGASWQKIEPQ